MKRVLLIDGDDNFCHYIKKNLELFKEFEVLAAAKGLEGLEVAKKEKPDLILIDHFIPGMPADEVSALLHRAQETANIPIVFLTTVIGKSEMGASGFKESGGEKFIAKPVTPEELIRALNNIFKAKQR